MTYQQRLEHDLVVARQKIAELDALNKDNNTIISEYRQLILRHLVQFDRLNDEIAQLRKRNDYRR